MFAINENTGNYWELSIDCLESDEVFIDFDNGEFWINVDDLQDFAEVISAIVQNKKRILKTVKSHKGESICFSLGNGIIISSTCAIYGEVIEVELIK